MKTLKLSLLAAALFVAGNASAAQAAAAAPAAGDAKAAAAAPAPAAAVPAVDINALHAAAVAADKVATDAAEKVTADQAKAAYDAKAAFTKANKEAGMVARNWASVKRNKVNTAIIAAAIIGAGAAVYYKVTCDCDAEAAPAA